MSNAVGWFEIYVQDMPRARAFYETVLGVSLAPLPSEGMENPPGMEMLAFPMDPQTYGAAGALVKMPGYDSGANSVLVYFSCADCTVPASRAAAAGGQLLQAKMPIGPYGFIALIVDTEGNRIGLHSMA
jgi:uncharacterized protein